MIKVYNMRGEEIEYFGSDTNPFWAVVYCYCEQHNLLSALFSADQRGEFEDFAQGLPIIRGKIALACGDWVTRGC